jgi:hypothetical protein
MPIVDELQWLELPVAQTIDIHLTDTYALPNIINKFKIPNIHSRFDK